VNAAGVSSFCGMGLGYSIGLDELITTSSFFSKGLAPNFLCGSKGAFFGGNSDCFGASADLKTSLTYIFLG
jgi:hypothetical protein